MSDKIVRGTLRTILRRYTDINKFNLKDQEGSWGSTMSNIIHSSPKLHGKIRVCVVFHDEQPVGWAWKLPIEEKLDSCMLYVLPAYRRVGFGSVLFKEIIKTRKSAQIEVYPWDQRSRDVYSRLEIKTGVALKKQRYFEYC